MSFKKNILMITRPIAPPWNESSKNLSYELSTRSTRYQIHLMTVKGNQPLKSSNIIEEPIYSKDSLMTGVLPLTQKLRVLMRLLKPDPKIEIYHFFMAPKYYQSRLFEKISCAKGKKTVQSIICMITGRERNPFLFFGDEIVVFSKATKLKVEKLTTRSVTKIDPGIDINNYESVENGVKAKSTFSIGNRRVVLYCGDFNEEQGAWKLLRATSRLIKNVPDVLILFAARGKNSEHVQFRNKIKEEILNLKIGNHIWVLEDEWRVKNLIAACDVAILPADAILRKLDIPLLLLECLALQKPIVINNIQPLNEIMREEVGIILKTNSEEEISDVLSMLLNNKELCKKMGKAGRALVKKDFSIELMLKKYESIYERIFNNA